MLNNGHTIILKYILSKFDLPFDTNDANKLAWKGELDILKWLKTNLAILPDKEGAKNVYNKLIEAKKYERKYEILKYTKILEWLNSKGIFP